jgi:hypothetical protein
MTFCDWLEWQCSLSNITQAALCRAVNAHPGAAQVSRQAVHRWFAGTAAPSVPSLVALCDVLELTGDQRAQALRLIAQGAA